MMRVLSVGEDPATVDFTKTPSGVDEAYIRAGIDQALATMRERGWDARMCIVNPDIEAALFKFKAALAAGPWDVLLLGGGLRMPPERLELFEALVNEAHRSAPNARLAFDNDPHDGAEAVARQLVR